MEIIKCFEIEASFSLQSIEFKIEDYLHIKDRLSQGDNFRTIVKNNWRISLFQSLSKLVWKKCWNHRELKASLTESSIHSKKPSPNETSQDPYLDTKPFALIPIRHALIACRLTNAPWWRAFTGDRVRSWKWNFNYLRLRFRSLIDDT